MNVNEKLMHIQTKLKSPKSQFNAFGKYSYRSCEDILESLKPLLEEYKATVTLKDEIKLIGDRYYLEATATLTDIETGEKVEVSALAREEEIKKGMDAAQVTGSVSSYARKYALNGLFAIDDNKDADSTNTHGKSASKETKLSDAQVKRLYAIAYKCKIDKSKIDAMVKDKFSKSITELTKSEYDQVCEGLQARLETLG